MARLHVRGRFGVAFDPEEFRPVGRYEVFARDPAQDDAVAWEQAAQLVMLGVALSGDDELLEVLRVEGQELGVPDDLSGPSPLYFDSFSSLAGFVSLSTEPPYRYDDYAYLRRAGQGPLREAMRHADFVRDVWTGLLERGDPERAVAFIAMHLWSPVALLQACAAMVLTRVQPEVQFMRPMLSRRLASTDPQVSAMANQGLVNLRTQRELTGEDWGEHAPAPQQTGVERSIAVHGTFAGFPGPHDWFHPDSDWSTHVRREVPCDLWSKTQPRPFGWEGRFWGKSRRKAVQELHAWTKRGGVEPIRVAFAHSHGGNVALDYLSDGGGIDLLVLMHTPVIARRRQTWDRIAANVGRVLVLRTKLDLVVWADRLASPAVLRLPQITALDHRIENSTIPAMGLSHGWFSHGFFTDVKTWRAHGVAQLVGAQLDLIEQAH